MHTPGLRHMHVREVSAGSGESEDKYHLFKAQRDSSAPLHKPPQPSRKNNPPLSRPSLNTSMAIPSAPELPSEAYLEVFIHPDGPFQVNTAEPASKFRNTRDLERLGRRMVEMAYMHIMYSRWPNVTGDQLTVSAIHRVGMRTTRCELKNTQTLTNATVNGVMERAVRAYRWKEQIRGCPPHIDLMQSSEVRSGPCVIMMRNR